MADIRYLKAQKRRLSDAASDTSKQMRRIVLQVWSELPSWQSDDNEFIETGYRPVSGSCWESVKSWGYLHNETVNIFSHIIGSVLFFTLPFVIYKEVKPRYETATSADIVVFAMFFFCVAICFALSVTFHTLLNHSPRLSAFGMLLDFQGILLLMWGAMMPTIYYSLYCSARLQRIYWSIISVLGLTCSIFTFTPIFRSPFMRPLRASLFGGFALSTLVPVIHSVIVYGWDAQNYRVSLYYLLGTLACNTMGALAYAVKFPERFRRRTFDIFGASHQILHIMVLIAAFVHMFGLLRDFDHLHTHPIPCRGKMSAMQAMTAAEL